MIENPITLLNPRIHQGLLQIAEKAESEWSSKNYCKAICYDIVIRAASVAMLAFQLLAIIFIAPIAATIITLVTHIKDCNSPSYIGFCSTLSNSFGFEFGVLGLGIAISAYAIILPLDSYKFLKSLGRLCGSGIS